MSDGPCAWGSVPLAAATLIGGFILEEGNEEWLLPESQSGRRVVWLSMMAVCGGILPVAVLLAEATGPLYTPLTAEVTIVAVMFRHACILGKQTLKKSCF